MGLLVASLLAIAAWTILLPPFALASGLSPTESREYLHLRTLPDGKVLAEFNFTTEIRYLPRHDGTIGGKRSARNQHQSPRFTLRGLQRNTTTYFLGRSGMSPNFYVFPSGT